MHSLPQKSGFYNPLIAGLCLFLSPSFSSWAETTSPAHSHTPKAQDPQRVTDCEGSPRSGETCADGTIFVGNGNLVTLPADGDRPMDWESGKSYCESMSWGGRTDWYLPDIFELNLLYRNRHKIGGFATSGDWSEVGYWSSMETDSTTARVQSFSQNGQNTIAHKTYPYRVRCVRRR